MTDHGNIYGAVHFFEAAQGQRHQAHPGLRALRVQVGGSSRRRDLAVERVRLSRRRAGERVQPPAGAGGKRGGLPEPDPADVGGEPERVLSQAAGEQEVSGGKLQGVDRHFRLPERRAVRGARKPTTMPRPFPSRSNIRTSSAKEISFSRFRTRVWNRRKTSAPSCFAWNASWAFRWWRPTTRIICAARTRMRTM